MRHEYTQHNQMHRHAATAQNTIQTTTEVLHDSKNQDFILLS